MHLVVIAWLYVTLLMGLVEAFSTQGTVLGAIMTFLLYGLLPMGLVVYLMGTPLRRKAKVQSERMHIVQSTPPLQAATSASALEPDAGSHSAGLPETVAVAPMRKEP